MATPVVLPTTARSKLVWPQLHLCSRFDDVNTLKELLEKKADVNEPAFSVNMSALQIAAASDMKNATAWLINAKANVNATDKRGHTPLYSAAAKGHDNIVLLMHTLRASELDLNIKSRQGWTPLFAAVRHNHMRTVQVLLQLKADATSRNVFDMTVLHVAAHRGYHDIMKLLLTSICSLGADKSDADTSDADTSDPDSSNADTSNADRSNTDTSDADRSNADRSNAATRSKSSNEIAEFVNREMPTSIMLKAVEVSANLDADDKTKSPASKRTLLTSGETALMIAAKRGDAKMCKLLLQREAWPLMPNSLRTNAVDFASLSNNTETCALLQRWAVLSTCTASPKCATLCQAARAMPAQPPAKFGHLACVCFLLRGKACPNQYDRQLRPDILPYTSPLTIAAGSGNPAMVRKLLDAKAHVDGIFGMPDSQVIMFRDSSKSQSVVSVPERLTTPLAVAACAGQYAVVIMLCEAKANVNARVPVSQLKGDMDDEYCATAIFAAARSASVSSVAALLQAKADPFLKDSKNDSVLEAVAQASQQARDKIKLGRAFMSAEAAGAYAAWLFQLKRVSELLNNICGNSDRPANSDPLKQTQLFVEHGKRPAADPDLLQQTQPSGHGPPSPGRCKKSAGRTNQGRRSDKASGIVHKARRKR